MTKKFEKLLETMRCPECNARLRMYQTYPKDVKRRYRWLNCKNCGFEIIEKHIEENE